MARPAYETPADRAKEKAFADAMAGHLGVLLHQMARFSPIDFAAIDPTTNRVLGLVELKTRKNPSTRYPTFFLSSKKVTAARTFRHHLGLPVTLFVQWTDKVGELAIDEVLPAYYTIAGRGDRGDAQDVELMAHWPISAFNF